MSSLAVVSTYVSVVVGVYINSRPIQVLMEFLNHCTTEGEKLQLVCWVVGFGLAQASTGIGYHCLGAALSSLIEDSPQTSPTSISMKLEWLSKIGIHKDRYLGKEFLQVVKGLLTSAVPLNCSLLLAHIFT